MPAPRLILVEGIVLAATMVAGGPPWTCLAALTMLAHVAVDLQALRIWPLAPAMAWLVACHVTGDRRLFFPYTISLAVHATLLIASRSRPLGLLAGGAVVATFLVIRGLQQASPRVLVVEAAAAIAILSLSWACGRPCRDRLWLETGLVAAASLAAYATLAL